jgi:hypothetical protein
MEIGWKEGNGYWRKNVVRLMQPAFRRDGAPFRTSRSSGCFAYWVLVHEHFSTKKQVFAE